MILTSHHCRAFGLRRALFPVLLWSFRTIVLTRQLTTAPMCWMSLCRPHPRGGIVAPEHGPGLVGGTITLDCTSFTTIHSGTTASTA